MNPEIKAAIEKESNEHEARCWRMEPWVDITHEKSFTAGAEYGYKLGKERYDLAVKALKYIANSTPSPDQTFEIENKLAAQKALKELGE